LKDHLHQRREEPEELLVLIQDQLKLLEEEFPCLHLQVFNLLLLLVLEDLLED
jgi:hypothetical protein